MANPLTYGQEQAERNLEYWKILDQPMRKPTALASPEERRAYTAQQVRGGELPSYMLPEQYGGMPVGSTRRAIRARSQWADQQAQIAAYNEEMAAREQAANDARIFELDYATKVLNLQNEQLKNKQNKQDEAQIANEVNQLRKMIDSIDPITDPEAGLKIEAAASSFPLGSIQPEMKEILTRRKGIADAYGIVKRQQDAQNKIKEIQDKYVSDMQKLMETGVTEEQLPEYYDPNSPVGIIQFDPRKVAARLGTTEAQKIAETKMAKEETPKEKIGIDYQQAAAELNDILMAGGDTESAQAKVAGLRARYKAATGEDVPMIYPQPQTIQQLRRLPAGTIYIGQDGKKYSKK